MPVVPIMTSIIHTTYTTHIHIYYRRHKNAESHYTYSLLLHERAKIRRVCPPRNERTSHHTLSGDDERDGHIDIKGTKKHSHFHIVKNECM